MADTVVLGLSGGVDSAVAARLLQLEGYEVHCVYLDNGLPGGEDAQTVARALGLPFERVDIAGELERHVCTPFAEGYLAGETPSPCALCNPTVKFPALLARADALGARYVATGHYARTRAGQLLRGQSPNDQSYMLARLTGEQLQRVIFPLGEYDKSSVRRMAARFGLPVADKPDSMEICFIPDDDYAAWLERRGPTPGPGDFVDPQGNVLGRHRGYHRYTLGQGRGLGLSGPHKYYVSEIRPAENRVVLSDGTDLLRREVRCRDLNWLDPAPLTAPRDCTARFRHSRGETPVRLEPEADGRARALAPDGVRAPTPGQLAVFYNGDTVLGSGWIV